MSNYSDVRIFLCTTPTDMHYSFDRLLGRTREIFEQDPLDGHLFLFVNRNRDRLKLLFWDQDGFCIFYKKLDWQCPHFFLFTEISGDADNRSRRPVKAVRMDSSPPRIGPRRRPMSGEIAVSAPPAPSSSQAHRSRPIVESVNGRSAAANAGNTQRHRRATARRPSCRTGGAK